MYYFRIPFLGVFVLGEEWIPLVTVMWLLGMSQAINSSTASTGWRPHRRHRGGAFFLYAQRMNDLGVLLQPNIGPLVAIIAVGLCVGFLPHNFNPARIFMGDSGALLLGLLMAVSTSVVGGRADPDSGQYTPVRRTSSSLRCSSRSSSSVSRSSTPCSRSSAAPAAARAWPRPTRDTCTTA